jgi:hypothetical protein
MNRFSFIVGTFLYRNYDEAQINSFVWSSWKPNPNDLIPFISSAVAN